MLGLFTLPDEAYGASEAIGDDCVSRYARDISHEANEYVSNPDWGESVSLVPLYEEDRVALTLLSAIDSVPHHYEKGSFVQGPEDWAKCEANPEDWADKTFAVVYVTSTGFGIASFYASEEDAREDYEAQASADQFRDEEDEDEEQDVPCIHGNMPSECLDPTCRGEHPFLSEVKDAELWGGTE